MALPDPDLEFRILRALCNPPLMPASPHRDDPDLAGESAVAPAANRGAILAQLRTHRWQDPEHRVVFEALTALPGRSATELREQLPAQATRMGFPDVNWDHYLGASEDHAELEALVAELLAISLNEDL